MERKWLAALLPLTMMGAVSLAANPFADVTPDDWAYQAVSELSEEGVVSGHPDGMFRGERNVTRYERAQIRGHRSRLVFLRRKISSAIETEE